MHALDLSQISDSRTASESRSSRGTQICSLDSDQSFTSETTGETGFGTESPSSGEKAQDEADVALVVGALGHDDRASAAQQRGMQIAVAQPPVFEEQAEGGKYLTGVELAHPLNHVLARKRNMSHASLP
jgi:hypothetical protein